MNRSSSPQRAAAEWTFGYTVTDAVRAAPAATWASGHERLELQGGRIAQYRSTSTEGGTAPARLRSQSLVKVLRRRLPVRG